MISDRARQRLKRVLNLKSGEEAVFFHLLGFCAGIGVPMALIPAVTTALFLERYGADALPWAYVAASVVGPLVAFVSMRAADAIASRWFIIVQIVALGLVPLGLFAMLEVKAPHIEAVMMVAGEVLMVGYVLIQWSNIERLLDVRQARRLAGLVGAGTIAATMVSGALVPLFTTLLGTPRLLVGAGVVMALPLAFQLRINARWSARFDDDEDEDDDGGKASDALKIPLLVVLFLMAGASIFALNLIDNVLYLLAEARYPNADALANLIGGLTSAYALLTLVLQLTASSRWVSWLGLPRAVALLPGLVVGVGLALVVSLAVGLPGWVSLGLAAGLWVVFLAVDDALDTPLYLTLFRPLPLGLRSRAQETSESVVGQIGGGLSGALLLLLLGPLKSPPVALCVMIVAVGAVWIYWSRRAVTRYREALGDTLQRQALEGRGLMLEDPGTLALLEQAVQHDAADAACYALEQLSAAQHEAYPRLCLLALDHEEARVRRAGALGVERVPDRASAPAVLARLEREPDPEVRGAMLRAWVACTEDIEALEALPDAHAPELERARMVAQLKHGGLRGALLAGPELLQQLAADAPNRRQEAARRLQAVGEPTLYRELMPLLTDPSWEVRRAALEAAGGLGHPRLWPAVVAALDVPETRRIAARVLAHAGPHADAAAEALASPGADARATCRRLRALGRLGAGDALLVRAQDADAMTRSVAMRALRGLDVDAEPEALRRCLRGELERTARVAALRSAAPTSERLLRALDETMDALTERAFGWLALLHPDQRVWAIWEHLSDDENRALAVEMLDDSIPSAPGCDVLALVESDDPNEQRQALASAGYSDAVISDARSAAPWSMPQAGALAADPLVDRWLRALLVLERDDAEDDALRRRVERVAQLQRSPLMAPMPGAALMAIADLCRDIALTEGEVLMREGELGDALYVVVRGVLRVHRDEDLAVLGPGDVVGELAALVPEPRSATVTAEEDSALLELPRLALVELIDDAPEVAQAMLEVLARRVRSVGGERLGVAATPAARASQPTHELYATDASDTARVLTLRKAALFASAPDALAEALAAVATLVEPADGADVIRPGEPSRTIYVVVEGEVILTGEDDTLALIGPGGLVGELATLLGEPHRCGARAVEGVRLLALRERDVLPIVRAESAVAWAMLEAMVASVREASRGA